MSRLKDLRIDSLERENAALKERVAELLDDALAARDPSSRTLALDAARRTVRLLEADGFAADMVPAERLAAEIDARNDERARSRKAERQARYAEKRVAELERELKSAKAFMATQDEAIRALSAPRPSVALGTPRRDPRPYGFRSGPLCRAVNYREPGLSCGKPVGHGGMHRDMNPIGHPGRIAFWTANDTVPVFRR